jgi:hypothetical protein
MADGHTAQDLARFLEAARKRFPQGWEREDLDVITHWLRSTRPSLALAALEDCWSSTGLGARAQLYASAFRKALDKCSDGERTRNAATARADAAILNDARRQAEAREVRESWDRIRAEIAAHPERAVEPVLADLERAGWRIPAGRLSALADWPRGLLLAVRDILVDEEIDGTPAEEHYIRRSVVGFRVGR